jgi:tellurite resistance protein TerC
MTIVKVKRFLVTLIGFTILMIGIVMIVFPGPAFIIIPLGLAILGTEYVCANKIFEKMKKGVKKTFGK